jgi:anionic cell wall polymer biosynthesis LytR-Cps2A-Psr (LCP) family protein
LATVVSIMDRDGWLDRTDNIVRLEPKREELEWIPRDLWSDAVGDRVNTAFRSGGHRMLMDALAEHGRPVDASVCFRRSALERHLERLSLTVPVTRPLDFWYPSAPTERLQDGRKLVSFRPPQERLAGERIHQWLGARTPVGRGRGLPDLARIERQKIFVQRLLEERFRFSKLLEDPALVSFENRPRALAELSQVQPSWQFRTFDGVHIAEVDGKLVLVTDRTRVFRYLARLAHAINA